MGPGGTGNPRDSGLKIRVARLEDDVRDIKTILSRLEPLIVRMDAQIPFLATKAELAEVRAELADKPSRTYVWGVLTVLLAAYGCGLAALAVQK